METSIGSELEKAPVGILPKGGVSLRRRAVFHIHVSASRRRQHSPPAVQSQGSEQPPPPSPTPRVVWWTDVFLADVSVCGVVSVK